MFRKRWVPSIAIYDLIALYWSKPLLKKYSVELHHWSGQSIRTLKSSKIFYFIFTYVFVFLKVS